jgi:hypothetical protein
MINAEQSHNKLTINKILVWKEVIFNDVLVKIVKSSIIWLSGGVNYDGGINLTCTIEYKWETIHNAQVCGKIPE